MAPAPSESAVPSDSEAEPKRKIRTAEPDPGILIPARPDTDGIPVNRPRIVCGNVNNRRISRSDIDGSVRIVRHGLLRRSFQIADRLRLLAHHLHGVHYVLLLVVVGVTQRRRPGNVL